MTISNQECGQTVYYRDWHPSVVEKIDGEYHIVKDGILSKRDYTLLFNSGDEKHHIPVQTTDQLNCYNEVTITGAVFCTLTQENIRLGIYDGVGNLLGYYTPEGYQKDTETILAQCLEYSNTEKRPSMGKLLEISAIHNIRANVRYYIKQGRPLEETEQLLTDGMSNVKKSSNMDEILLHEARCRQAYYRAFNTILENEDFYFEKRSKMPPKDAVNALISFGNTILYNKIQQMIWKTSLDSRIGVLHAANRRHYSLNLDFADLFKPLIVDRVIFKLVNLRQLTKEDFIKRNDGSVYLTSEGKKLFIRSIEEKMTDRIMLNGEYYTYRQLMEQEIRSYQRYLLDSAKYRPYKYY